MIKFANQKLDFLDEKSPSKIGLEYEAPKHDYDYGLILKTASGEYLKKYPLNNYDNCVYSFVSYEHNKHKLTPEMQKIAESNMSKRLNFYKIENSLSFDKSVTTNTYLIKESDEKQFEKKAEVPKEYAYKDKLPIDTVENLQKSANEFLKQAKKLSIKDRKEVAFNLVKKASELKVELPTSVLEYSSTTPKKFQQIKVAMTTRMMSYPIKVKNLVNNLLENIKTSNDAIKVAEMVDKIDSKVGIKKSMHKDVARDFFSIEKTAEQKKQEKLANALDAGMLDEYFDKDIIDALKKEGSEAYEKLNPRSKTIIDYVLKAIR